MKSAITSGFKAAAMGTSSLIPWVKHEARNAADPCIAQLIAQAGFEGYGRYWRLIELLADSPEHALPKVGERAFRRFQIGLRFEDEESFAGYLETLAALDLIERSEDGRCRIPLIDATAMKLEAARANGKKGGLKAAANRRSGEIRF